MPEIDELDRAIRLGTLSAVALAIVGAALVFSAWRWASRRSQLQLLMGFAATLALCFVYFVAATQIVSGAYPLRPRAGEQDFVLSGYVHPGPLVKLAPAVAIVVTWAILLVASKKFPARKPRPNST